MGKALGNAIRRHRERLHMTQSDLAQKVGVSLRTVGNWERGESVPQNRLAALEEALGLDSLSLTGVQEEEAGEAAPMAGVSGSEQALLDAIMGYLPPSARDLDPTAKAILLAATQDTILSRFRQLERD